MIEFAPFYEQLLNGYRSNYDITPIENGEDGLICKAHMHVTEAQCVVFEEFKMWTANADEYVYIYHIPHLTEELTSKVIDEVYADGFPLIDLDHVSMRQQHMRTNLVALFICDTADEAAIRRLKKCRIYKSFQFSLKGWMEMHTDLITLTDSKVYSNRYGVDTAKFLKMHVKHFERSNVQD